MSDHRHTHRAQPPSAPRPRIPRSAALAVWVPLFVFLHVVVPYLIVRAMRAPTVGTAWPSGARVAGLGLVAFGLGVVGWCLALHVRAAPQGWELRSTPDTLLTEGPYRWSRNPVYLGVVIIWLGWATFYGSIALLIIVVVGWIVLDRVVVPWEEKALRARFGQEYDRYARRLPRWLGLQRGPA